MKYTEEETKEIVEYFLKNKEDEEKAIKTLAEVYNRSIPSIRSKLSYEGVYSAKIARKKERSETKAEIARSIEEKLETELPQLDKAPKQTLLALRNSLTGWLG